MLRPPRVDALLSSVSLDDLVAMGPIVDPQPGHDWSAMSPARV